MPEKLDPSLGAEHGGGRNMFSAPPGSGTLVDASGARAASVPPELLRGLHYVLEKTRGGAWDAVLKKTGRASGTKAAAALDLQLEKQQRPMLAAMPVETALEFLARHFLTHGWGLLTLDLSHAPRHGFVLAHLEHSWISDALRDTRAGADAFSAGVLQAFFEHISGDILDCAEISCVRRDAARSTFVVTTADRLGPLLPLLGRESAEQIVARLRA